MDEALDDQVVEAEEWRGRAARRRRERSETRILQAAAVLFREQSYATVTIERIAKRAGVGPATVYNRFGTKAALAAQVLREPILDLQRAAEGDIARGVTIDVAVSGHFQRLARLAEEHRDLLVALLEALHETTARRDPLPPDADPRFIAPLPDPLAAILAAAQSAHTIALAIPPAKAAAMITNAFAIRVIRGDPADEAARDSAELLLYGVRRVEQE